MPHQSGTPKTPGSGRKKGTPTKKVLTVEQIFKRWGTDPINEALKCQAMMQALLKGDLEIAERLKLLVDTRDGWLKLARFVYPERKAVEVTAEVRLPLVRGTRHIGGLKVINGEAKALPLPEEQ